MRRAGRGLAAAALMFVAVACTEDPYSLPPPPSEADRAGFGPVGLVVHGAPIPENKMPVGQAVDAGGGAILGGATMGAYGAGVMAASPPIIFGSVLFPPAAFVGVAVVVGAATGMFAFDDILVPENVKLEIDALMLAEWAEFEAASGVKHRLATAAASVTDRSVAAEIAPVPDGVLTIQITYLGLKGWGGQDPALKLVVSIEATLTGAGGEELHGLKLSYAGVPYKFSHWRADGARALQDEFARAFDVLGERVHEELFLLWLPRPETET